MITWVGVGLAALAVVGAMTRERWHVSDGLAKALGLAVLVAIAAVIVLLTA